MNIFEHISQAVSLEQFTLDAVNFIAQEFGFSFVGLFLIDAPREHAVFQTGTGNAGLMIKKRNHKVPLSCDLQEFDGLVCESINKNAICCSGATLIEGFFYSRLVSFSDLKIPPFEFLELHPMSAPYLPDTRFAMSCPLRTSHSIIGALMLHHSKSYIDVRSTAEKVLPVADQVAKVCFPFLQKAI